MKVKDEFVEKLDHAIELISKNPNLFTPSQKKNGIRKPVVTKFNTLYYWKKEDVIEILSLFSNRKNPDKINI